MPRENAGAMQAARRSLSVAARLLIFIVSALILSACAQPWDPDTDSNVLACRSSYGFTPGTPNFDKCMQELKATGSHK